MRLSDEKTQLLFQATHEPVMKLRVKHSVNDEDLDIALFNMQLEIWKEVKKVLNMDT